MNAVKDADRIHIKKHKFKDNKGRIEVFEELSLKSIPKLTAVEGHKDSLIKYFINNRNRMVAQVRKDNTIAMYNSATKDVIKHKIKGWSVQKCLRFVYLMTLKQK